MTTSLANNNVRAVILAAGRGKRMQSNLPKVMHRLHGKPLIEYVVTAVEQAGLGRPLVVVSGQNTMVQDYLGERAEYVVQSAPLGTGHAVLTVEPILKNSFDAVLVLPGDMPGVTVKTIRGLAAKQAVVALATTTVPNFLKENVRFNDFGRVVRVGGKITKIVEYQDASAAERDIHELNTGVFLFQAGWLWKHIHELNNTNAQKEYYLVDLVAIAVKEGHVVAFVAVSTREALGVNTQEQLQALSNH